MMDQRRFTRVAKALADPQRFEILEAISKSGEMSCGAIAERFPVKQSTVSHHLKTLMDADLISVRREGQCGYFTLRSDTLDSYVKELRDRIASPLADNAADNGQ